MKAMSATDIIVAGGLLPELKNEYFRVGHMGSVNRNDLIATIGAIESAMIACGNKTKPGTGISAALANL
jgi:alanine-glyoxylate transaminase/serine-glyoxylate transaminase/serine-pyruvate transaminase